MTMYIVFFGEQYQVNSMSFFLVGYRGYLEFTYNLKQVTEPYGMKQNFHLCRIVKSDQIVKFRVVPLLSPSQYYWDSRFSWSKKQFTLHYTRKDFMRVNCSVKWKRFSNWATKPPVISVFYTDTSNSEASFLITEAL